MKLSIPTQCSESFDSFRPTSAGNFCQSCQKEVVDFRHMTDSEILAYFAQHRGKTCGSFRPAQLKTYEVPPQRRHRRFHKILGAGALSFSLFTFLPIMKGQAQTQETISVAPDSVALAPADNVNTGDPGYTVIGTIVDEEGSPLAFATILLEGTRQAVSTNEYGKFTFDGLHPGDTLRVLYIGYVPQLIEVPEPRSQRSTRIKFDEEIKLRSHGVYGEVSVEGLYVTKASIWQRIGRAFR